MKKRSKMNQPDQPDFNGFLRPVGRSARKSKRTRFSRDPHRTRRHRCTARSNASLTHVMVLARQRRRADITAAATRLRDLFFLSPPTERRSYSCRDTPPNSSRPAEPTRTRRRSVNARKKARTGRSSPTAPWARISRADDPRARSIPAAPRSQDYAARCQHPRQDALGIVTPGIPAGE